MKVTKFVHSCLLIEQEEDKKVLIDPGNYSVEEGAITVNMLNKLDYLLITHEHPDHMYLPFIKELVGKFPNLPIISNSSVVEILEKEGIKATIKPPDFAMIEEVIHERVWGVEPPKNIMLKLFGKLTHPGDSHHFTTDTDILALPVQAPWGSTTAAVELAENLKPKIIIPIHDWHWNDTAREAMHKRLEDYFSKQGIRFIGIKTGEPIEV